MSHPRLAFRLAAALALASLAAADTCPEQPPIQNHTDPNFTPCPCFVAGEEFGAVLQIPAQHLPAEILRVRIYASSAFGGQPDVLGQALRVYPAGLPNPGTPIADLAGPVLSDGVINEFDLEPLPGTITISANPFTVSFKFGQDNVNDLFSPTAVYDTDGCQAGKNVIYAIPGGWFDACNLGVPGDWAISAVYRPLNCGGNQTYCVAAANSAGPGGAQIGIFGSTSFAANDLILTCTGLPSGQPGIFFYGPNQVQLPFGDGFRCVGGTLFRLYPPVSGDLFGNAARPVDYALPPMDAGGGMIQPGVTFNFQFWYRDPAFGGAGFNLSNAQTLVFTP
ncbi:MAG: hypothetical protein H6828_12785 [Planctomycetes bacterium]|nr:hypothetical protein [Planctomycetota bacterium]